MTQKEKIINQYHYNFNYQDFNKYNKIKKLNESYKKIFFNKGKKIYLNSLDKSFNSTNNKIFNDNNIGLIYSFLCSKSGYMRYYVYNDYNKMLKFNKKNWLNKKKINKE